MSSLEHSLRKGRALTLAEVTVLWAFATWRVGISTRAFEPAQLCS